MKRLVWVALLLVALIVAALAGSFVASNITARRTEEARAKIKPTESIAKFEALRDSTSATSPGASGNNVDRWRQRIAAFEELFRKTAFLEEDSDWNELSDLLGEPESNWRGRTRDELHAFIESNQLLIDEIRAAAAEGGPVVALRFSGYHVDVDHFSPMRNFARLLFADATVAAELGDMDRVARDAIATMQLGDALAEEPMLLSQLVRFAIYGMGRSGLELIDIGGLSADHYERLTAQVAQGGRREEFAGCFAGEAVYSQAFFENIETFGMSDWGNVWFGGLMALYGSPVGRPFMNLDASTTYEIFAEMQEVARLPFYEAQEAAAAIDERIDNLSRFRVHSRRIMGLGTTLAIQAHHEAALDIARLGLAIERFHLDTGSYPATLEAALPEAATLVDPFTGNPYVYRPAEDSFLLYSVGANQIDDHGQVGQLIHTGDIVWRGVRDPG